MKVKIRIALAVDADGGWNASGWSKMDEKDAQNIALEGCKDDFPALYWVETEVDTPEDSATRVEAVATPTAL